MGNAGVWTSRSASSAVPRCSSWTSPPLGSTRWARRSFHDLVHRLSDLEDTTILLTTHDLDEAEKLADRILILDRGRIVADGSAEALARRVSGRAEVRWSRAGETGGKPTLIGAAIRARTATLAPGATRLRRYRAPVHWRRSARAVWIPCDPNGTLRPERQLAVRQVARKCRCVPPTCGYALV